tara:strand:+ start:579 stop:1526 length:948 start_codon:yes stop_codon:yes gene_type:complete
VNKNKIKKIISLTIISLLTIVKVSFAIEDGVFISVGNKAITKSDIVNEIKIILILNNQSYSSDRREQLQDMAIKSIIKRSIKLIEIERNNYLEFNSKDGVAELNRLASNIGVDLDTLKNICASNDLDFSLVENQVKVELLWNSLIFQLYKDRLTINVEEIDDQLKLIQNKKEREEFLISEIIINNVEKDNLEEEIIKLKERINNEGFENVAMELSISDTAIKGGDLGWIAENIISEKFKSTILNTSVGEISKPISLPEGILIFKVRDRRKVQKNLTLEEQKNLLVNNEKTKILKMYSLSHYDILRRSIAVKFLND